MNRKCIVVFAGGQSEEHEVSIKSARSVTEVLHGAGLESVAQVITRDGLWLSAEESRSALSSGNVTRGGQPMLQRLQALSHCDFAFPLIHGPFGEDGTVQGMLELANIPYVGCGVLASAVCMDKAVSNKLLGAYGVPQAKHVLLTRRDHPCTMESVAQQMRGLNPPWFVKPANLGSSVGITMVKQEALLDEAIETAFSYDRRVVVEEGMANARELTVGIMGNEKLSVSPVGEVTFDAEFFDYETKCSEGSARIHLPQDIPDEVIEKTRWMAERAYRILDCADYVRADFLYNQQSGALVLNELNTIPSLGPYSLFSMLWAAAGMSYEAVVLQLIELAMKRHQRLHRRDAA